MGAGDRPEAKPARPQTRFDGHLSAAKIEVKVVDPALPGARLCLREYFAELDRRFDAGYDPEVALPCDDDEMRAPRGVFLLATADDKPAGCVALKFHAGPAAELAELKRMWVSPEVRGVGIGRRLLEEAEARAKDAGSQAVRLDSHHSLTEAIALYRSAGYVPIASFNEEPYADRWFEKRLHAGAPPPER